MSPPSPYHSPAPSASLLPLHIQIHDSGFRSIIFSTLSSGNVRRGSGPFAFASLTSYAPYLHRLDPLLLSLMSIRIGDILIPTFLLSLDRARVCVSMASCNHELFLCTLGYRTRCSDELPPHVFCMSCDCPLFCNIHASARRFWCAC